MTVIAVPNIAAAAETVDALLRDMVAGLAPAAKVTTIGRELAAFGRDFDATEKETRLALGAIYSQEQLGGLDTRWLSLLARHEVEYLMLVPNACGHGGRRLENNDGRDFSDIIERHGYRLLAMEPKYRDPIVQENAINPTFHHLFRLQQGPR